MDPFSKHNSHLWAYSVKYNIWTEKFGAGPRAAYREVRGFSCEGGPDKFIRSIQFWFRPYDEKKVLGGIKVIWSNGSTDVAGATPETLLPGSPPVELECHTAECRAGREGELPEAEVEEQLVHRPGEAGDQHGQGDGALGRGGRLGEEGSEAPEEGSPAEACLP